MGKLIMAVFILSLFLILGCTQAQKDEIALLREYKPGDAWIITEVASETPLPKSFEFINNEVVCIQVLMGYYKAKPKFELTFVKKWTEEDYRNHEQKQEEFSGCVSDCMRTTTCVDDCQNCARPNLCSTECGTFCGGTIPAKPTFDTLAYSVYIADLLGPITGDGIYNRNDLPYCTQMNDEFLSKLKQDVFNINEG